MVSLRQSFIVAALTSAGSTRLTRLKGSLRIFAARGQDFANGHRWSIKANVCRFPRHVTGFVVRQQERNWSVAHDEDAPRSAFPGPSRETIRPGNVFETTGKENGLPARLWSI